MAVLVTTAGIFFYIGSWDARKKRRTTLSHNFGTNGNTPARKDVPSTMGNCQEQGGLAPVRSSKIRRERLEQQATLMASISFPGYHKFLVVKERKRGHPTTLHVK